MVNKLTDANFDEEVLKYKGTYLVDMYADWCGPCKIMSPVIDALSEESIADVKFGKVNIDEAEEVATRYGIMSIPTFLIFKNGELIKSFIGVTDIDELRNSINS